MLPVLYQPRWKSVGILLRMWAIVLIANIAGTFAFSAYMVSKLSLRGTSAGGGKFEVGEVGKDIREGIRFLREHSLARAMTIGIVMGFVGVGSVIALGPIFAGRTLDAGAKGFGILVTAVGVGMGIGMASLGQVTKFVERERLFPLAMLSAGTALIVTAAMPNLALAALFTVVLGLFVGMTWVTGYSLLQENVADEFRGRTFGALNVIVGLRAATMMLALAVRLLTVPATRSVCVPMETL